MKKKTRATVAEPRSAALPPPSPRKRKSRELPNLSDCHCCKRRINSTNPKKRLRTLISEWRIVLLCKSCHSLVESSQYCSYCLSTVLSSSTDSFYECKRCSRRIHRGCASKFNFGPGNCDDFSVCFDCWAPKLLGNDYSSVCGGRLKRKLQVSADLNPLESSRVCDSQCRPKLGEETANEADVAVQNKIAAIDEDAQLAIQLHKAMNSSPRIARNSSVLNVNCVNVTELNANGNLDPFQQQVAIESRGFCKPTVDADDVNGVEADPFSNRELNGCLVKPVPDSLLKSNGAEDEKCNGDSNGYFITYSRRAQGSQNGRSKDSDGFFRMYNRGLLHVERGNPDHRVKTHGKKPSETVGYKNKSLYGSFDLENGILASTIALKSSIQSRALANAS